MNITKQNELPFYKTEQYIEIKRQLYKLNDLIRKAYTDGHKLEVYVAKGDERTGPAPIIQVNQFNHDGNEDSIT